MSAKVAQTQSGELWFVAVPKHWHVLRNKILFREIDDRSVAGDEELLTVSHITGVTPRSQKDNVNMFEAESKAGYKCVEVGDLAINTMWAWMGALGFSKHRGIVSPSYNVYRLRMEGDTGYYGRLFGNPNFTKEVVRYSTGIWESRLRLYPEGFFSIRSPVPPVAEQRRIAAYLDEATGKVDRLMVLRRRQMELLREQREAFIQQAVTRGLNPNAPLKDSGLPWLGQIPKHWAVKRGRFLLKPGRSSVKPGPFGTQLKISDYVETGIKVFNQETVISGDFQRSNNFITSQKFSELTEFETFPGEVLLTTRGTIGRCAIVPSDAIKAIIHPCLMRIRFNQQVIANEYAVAFIEQTKLFLEQVNLLSNATTIEVIYSENFRQVAFPVPPLEEQQEILAFIAEESAKTDRLLSAYTRQLELLTEYRAALIHECVTGQRSVPN